MRNYRLYIKDIFEAMSAVQTFVEGMDFDALVADELLLLLCGNLKSSEKQRRTFQRKFGKSIHGSLGGRWQECETKSSMHTLQLTTS